MHRILLASIALSVAASAKLPELDAVFWGEVRHLSSIPLVPTSPGSIRVIAKQNGVVIAQALVGPGQSKFVLKVPKDDGQNPRLPGTARANERVRVFIYSVTHDVEEEAFESIATGGLRVSSIKGEIVPTPLSVSADFSETSQGIGAWLVSHGLAAGEPERDSDGDGQCNESEYAAGTNPTDGSDVFGILEVSQIAGNNFIKFGPIRPQRTYTIWCCDNLDPSGWSKIGQVRPGTVSESFLFGHPTPNSPNLFYRLQVDAP